VDCESPILIVDFSQFSLHNHPFTIRHADHVMNDLAHQTAQSLVRLIPPSATPDFFEDYGLTLTAQQAQAVTMELLALTTYWITCAIRVSIPEPIGQRMHQAVHQQIREQWAGKFGLIQVPVHQVFDVMKKKHQTWEQISRHGGEPIAVFSEAAGSLEADNVISSQDEQKLLAVFLDLVPIDEIGARIAELEQRLR